MPLPHIIAESANQIGADTQDWVVDSWAASSREGRLKVILLPPERRLSSHSDKQETGATEWTIVTESVSLGKVWKERLKESGVILKLKHTEEGGPSVAW